MNVCQLVTGLHLYARAYRISTIRLILSRSRYINCTEKITFFEKKEVKIRFNTIRIIFLNSDAVGGMLGTEVTVI